MAGISEQLRAIYRLLAGHFGPQHWWPGETPFEVMVGAILIQNTNWNNVEKAIANLRDVDLLSLERLSALDSGLLAEYIRPAGYHNLKAARLHNLCSRVLEVSQGDLDHFLGQPLEELRLQLLGVKGIGPETADAILLYAARYPVFVVDTYTHRILSRHQLIDEECGYHQLQELFTDHLEADLHLFGEYHALLVQTGKHYCRKSRPDCSHCPLDGF
ncbi:endonuclease III domain-containing protein [Desulfogranum mediterraneum]|uniref:endonuclease III domain-containing protein n=1 Tax=Desulfogranum mediterraneum TaxID=160661 RepID=UPI0003F9C7C5|nr:endonuclease III domain-containing protein [Desulfogranum mediterraneum]